MISIIIPSFNRGKELIESLLSLNAQTCLEFEVIVVDDCSVEPVIIDVTEYRYRVKLHRNKKNLGAAASRNIGVKLSSCEWLCFLDDDDRFMDNKISILNKEIKLNESVDLFFHRAKLNLVNENGFYLSSVYLPDEIKMKDDIFKVNFIGGAPVIALKKDIFTAIGGFDEYMSALEDYDFAIKCIVNNLKIFYIKQVLIECNYFTKRVSVSKNVKNTKDALNHIYRKYKLTYTQETNFRHNQSVIMAFAYLMNLSRMSSIYYIKAFLSSRNLKFLLSAVLSLLNPKLLLKLRCKIHNDGKVN